MWIHRNKKLINLDQVSCVTMHECPSSNLYMIIFQFGNTAPEGIGEAYFEYESQKDRDEAYANLVGHVAARAL